MNIRNQIVQQAQSIDIVAFNEYPRFVNGIPNSVVIADTTVIEQLCPINPVTGFRDSDLVRLFSEDVSKQEKDLILSNLSVHFGKGTPKDLSDDEIMVLIPSRYAGDAVEIAKYKSLVDELIKDYEDRNKQPIEDPTEPVASVDTDSKQHP